jgi:hypothetical protein
LEERSGLCSGVPALVSEVAVEKRVEIPARPDRVFRPILIVVLEGTIAIEQIRDFDMDSAC